MKNKTIYIPIIIFIVFVIFIKLSGALQLFTVSSISDEPNLKVNSRFIGSSFAKIKQLSFTYYKTNIPGIGESISIHRLVALPGDTIESKSGVLWINGKNVDKELNLRRLYKISKKDYDSYIPEFIKNDECYLKLKNGVDSIKISLDDDYIIELPIHLKLLSYLDNTKLNEDLSSRNRSWSFDNFGPIILPAKKYFFMGDHRCNSIDSRFNGFVDEENLKGTLIFQLF